MEKKSVAFLMAFLMLFLGSGLAMIPSASAEFYDGSGPWVDKVVFSVITQDDNQVLALQNDEIDIIGDTIDPMFLDELLEAENIAVSNVLRNGYGYITINCDKYPFNITDFRRALAFALDKEIISDDYWDGLSHPHDSLVPAVNPFTIEGQLPYTYYSANVAEGNRLLDRAGFVDHDSDGIREAPDGSDFDVIIEVAMGGIGLDIGDYVADALVNLGVNATSTPSDFYDYLQRLYNHEDYDIVFIGRTLDDFDVDWMGDEYWSENSDTPERNFPNFRNASFDSWRNQLLYSIDYDEVYEAAIEMQKIFVYESPIIVCYSDYRLHAHRTDRFEGQVTDADDGTPSWWTNQKVHLKDSEGGPFGGTFRWSRPFEVDTFNILHYWNYYYGTKMLDELYDTLIKQNPDGTLRNWLAESYSIETHADNADVIAGHTRFTFNILQNVTWTDNMPLTAQDVAFTFNYMRDHKVGDYYSYTDDDLYAAYAPTDYTFVIEFMTESYWHISKFAETPILPKHQWMYEDPRLFNPGPYDLVTSGPYFVSDYVAGEFVELTKYSNHFMLPVGSTGGGVPPSVPPHSSTITPPTTPEEYYEQYAERVLDDISIDDKMDPILRDLIESGELSENVARTSDNDIKVMLFLSPTADYELVKQFVDINWRMDFKSMKLISASVESALELSKLETIEGVNYIQADTYLTKPEVDIAAPNMYEIGDVIGRTGTYASAYDGTGVVVGVVDDGVDFSLPDMQDAEYIDSDGNPGSFDPSGWGLTEMSVANRSYVADVASWLSDGNLLTYESGGKYYLNVTGWDPVCNNNGDYLSLMGLLNPYGDGYPYGNNRGFIGWYDWGWGPVNNASEFVYNEMWKDWEIPAPGAEDYTFGWAFQQRENAYMKLFANSMIYEGELIIDWNGTLAWTYMWEHAINIQDIDLNTTADRDFITDIMDWSFVDDYDEGYTYGVAGGETILSADLDDDGFDDIGIGSLTWVNDGFGYLSAGIDSFFCGIEDNSLAWAAMFNSEGAHGMWTASAIGARGATEYPNLFEDGRSGTVNLPGIANGSKIIAVKGLTSGDDYGAQFWAAGFHLDADGNFSYNVDGQKHKADMISNSWGYVNGAYLTLTYLTMAWDLLSAPGIIDVTYPGTLFLISSGNSGADYMSNGAPDSAFSVISVGGTIVTHAYNDQYEDGQLQLNQEAWFTSNDPSFVGIVKPDIVAPAIFGQSPNPFHNYWMETGPESTWWSGTSLACPIVAGATAVVLQAIRTHLVNPTWYDPAVLKNIMLSTASDIGVDPFIQGHGLVNITAAVDYVLNGGGVFFTSDSFTNYADVMADAWNYWVPEWAPFGVWHPNYGEIGDTPVGLESASIFFGNVYRTDVTTVNLTATNLQDFGVDFVQSDFDSVQPWYYIMHDQLVYTIETRAHIDTNIHNEYRNDIVDVSSLLTGPEFVEFMAASYITITADVGDGDFGMRVWDYADTIPNSVVNYWYNESFPGDYIQWVSGDTSNCNNLIARLSAPTSTTVGALFPNTPAIYLNDASANETHGSSVKLTFTIWEKVVDSTVAVTDDAGVSTVTLTVPSDAEFGIHEGSIVFVNVTSGYIHELPYSYMVVFEATGVEDEVKTIVDGNGGELTPYDSGSWSASYDAAAETKMDGGGHRTFVVEIPYNSSINATTLVLRAEWQNPGTVVDMYLRATTYHTIIQTDDGYGPPFDPKPTSALKNTIVWEEGDLINGTYYLELSIHTFDGTDAYEDIKITLQLYGLDALEVATVDPTWLSRDSTTAVYEGGDVLTGDHVEISNSWSLTGPTNLPEYAVTSTMMSIFIGLLYENSGTLVDGTVDNWPVPFDGGGLTYLWETVDGINEGDNVYVGMTSPTDLSFDVYEWYDDNEDGLVDESTELGLTPFISVDAGSAGLEEGTFSAPDDMSIAIRVFVWTYSWHPGDTYDITVDTRVSQDVLSDTADVTFDTYEFGRNLTMTVQFTAYTDTDVSFTYLLGDVTFNNYFAPIINITAPVMGGVYDGLVNITWTVEDGNADDEHFYEVLLSADGGVSFMLLAKGITDTNYTWNSAPFLARDTYVVQVRVYDNDTALQLGDANTEGCWPGLFGFDVTGVFSTSGISESPLAPIITGSVSISYYVGETGNDVSWYVYDAEPDILQIWIDGILYSEPVWDTLGTTITIDCDDLSDGAYNYTLYAQDTAGLSSSFATWVLVYDGTSPVIDNPADITYVLGDTGNVIIWHPSDENPSSYNLLLDGVSIRSGSWDSTTETISISVDGLSPGEYDYTLRVQDTRSNFAFDSVTVTVVSPTSTTTDTGTSTLTLPDVNIPLMISLAITIGSIGVIIVVAILFVRARK